MNINQELLRTLVEVSDSETFAIAAAKRRVTPSAISQQVKTLEAQLGLPLFERIGRKARLTEAGRALVNVLRDHFAAIDLALSGLVQDRTEVKGVVRIGAPGPFSRMWLRPRIVRMMQQYPKLLVEVRFDVPSVLCRGLLAGQYDFCVLVNEPDVPSLETTPVFVEQFVAVASPDYLEEHGTPRTAAEFGKHRFIVFDADLAMHATWWRTTFGRREPLTTKNIVARIASLDEMMALASAGLGITVLPNYFVAAAIASGAVVSIDPKEGKGGRQRSAKACNAIFLAWRKSVASTARAAAVREALLSPA